MATGIGPLVSANFLDRLHKLIEELDAEKCLSGYHSLLLSYTWAKKAVLLFRATKLETDQKESLDCAVQTITEYCARRGLRIVPRTKQKDRTSGRLNVKDMIDICIKYGPEPFPHCFGLEAGTSDDMTDDMIWKRKADRNNLIRYLDTKRQDSPSLRHRRMVDKFWQYNPSFLARFQFDEKRNEWIPRLGTTEELDWRDPKRFASARPTSATTKTHGTSNVSNGALMLDSKFFLPILLSVFCRTFDCEVVPINKKDAWVAQKKDMEVLFQMYGSEKKGVGSRRRGSSVSLEYFKKANPEFYIFFQRKEAQMSTEGAGVCIGKRKREDESCLWEPVLGHELEMKRRDICKIDAISGLSSDTNCQVTCAESIRV